MCTVTYIPQGEDAFILTSNRDENAARSPQHITHEEVEGIERIFPRDAAAGGTWFAASGDNRLACLLNGAFQKHKHRPPYRRSRGLMVLDFFEYENTADFVGKYVFEGMEPFTMILYDSGHLCELRWDEKDIYFKTLDTNGYYIWSSATLYAPEIQEKRNGWFREWLEGREDFSLRSIQQFHRAGGDGDPFNDFVMNRHGMVQTVSITNLVKRPDTARMIYHDLIRDQVKKDHIPLIQGD